MRFRDILLTARLNGHESASEANVTACSSKDGARHHAGPEDPNWSRYCRVPHRRCYSITERGKCVIRKTPRRPPGSRCS
jgi:hypothetical protein